MKSLKFDEKNEETSQPKAKRGLNRAGTSHFRTENTTGHEEGADVEDYIKRVNRSEGI